jgi:hypothetical protein
LAPLRLCGSHGVSDWIVPNGFENFKYVWLDLAMNEQSNVDPSGAKKAVIDLLRSRSKKARFVTELAAALGRSRIGKEQMEQAVAELQAEGTVMIRDNFCADPHLAGVDLRVVALVESHGDEDAQLSAIREIDDAWNKWLGEYLANHRCG